MQTRDKLLQYSKEELIDLIELYAKDSLALDGVWFQSVEKKDGMDAAIAHDANAWERFTVAEAQRIKRFLGLPEHPGHKNNPAQCAGLFSLNADAGYGPMPPLLTSPMSG